MNIKSRPARAGSVRVAGWQCQYLGHVDRQRIMDAARRLERATIRRGSRRHGGDLLQTGLRVLWALLYRCRGQSGVCDPSIQQLANEAQMVRSTAQDALARLEAAGIIGHVRRGLVVAGRWCQWTSAYFFASPGQWTAQRYSSETDYRSASVSRFKKEANEEEWAAPAGLMTEAKRVALGAKFGLVMA